MTGFPTLAVVIPHTHWDREWYRTQHEFQLLLVKVVDRVLDALENDPAFTFFLLDGELVSAHSPEDEGISSRPVCV